MTKQPDDFHAAAFAGNVNLLRQLLEKYEEHFDINSRNANWETALFRACAAGRLDAVRFLIDAGAKVNARARKRFSPLHVSAKFGHHAVLEELINSGAKLEGATIRRMTPLALAARYGQTECARVLLERKVDVSGSGADMFGRTPLHWAIKTGREEIINLLLKAGADVNFVDNFGKTPLMQSVKSNRPNTLRRLININGINRTHANRHYLKPIHVAAERGHRRCLDVLLENSIATPGSMSVDCVTTVEQKKTPLMIAASNGRPGTVKFLLRQGANANQQDIYGLTALDYVAKGRMFCSNPNSRRWRRSAVCLVRHGNVNPCLLSDWLCSWNDEDNAGVPVSRNALEFAFRSGFEDLARVAAIAGAHPRSFTRLFGMKTADLPEYATKLMFTLDWLRRYFRSPRPLKELARRAVRSAVGTPHFERFIDEMGLAPGIRVFLMFPELDDTATDSDESDGDGSVDEERDSSEDESDTELEMEPSVFDSDLYGDSEPFLSEEDEL